jgi:hypothetical protein
MAGTTHDFSWPMARRALAGLLIGFSAACGGSDPAASAPAQAVQVSMLRIEGVVEHGSTIATDVRVTGRCGQAELRTITDDDGWYALDLDFEDLVCDRIVIEYQKISFLPVYRVVPVPPTESPYNLDVELEALDALECGSELCHTERGNTDIQAGGVIARGYQIGGSGDRALDHIPPDMRTEDGELISFLGFQYVEVYDQPGEQIAEISGVDGCVRMSDDGLSWIGDVDPQTPDVDLDWYLYDPKQGTWHLTEQLGKLYFKRGNVFVRDEHGECHDAEDDLGRKTRELLPVDRETLPDVRAEEHYVADPCGHGDDPDPLHIGEYWVCGPVEHQGFYAYGRSAPQTSCYTLQATNTCGEPMQSVAFTARGVEHGFLHRAFTGPDGSACLEVMASEPIGDDFDLDGLGGEIFSVDLEIDGGRAGSKRIDFRENARELGTCEEPESCIQISEQLRGCSE